MHRQAFRWVEKLLLRYPEINPALANDLGQPQRDVLEFGSYDVNGTIRPLFTGARSYVGVDVREGPAVDVVDDARYYGADQRYDIVVSCEMLEHSPDPERVIRNAYRILRPGGHFILTCASQHRVPHNNDGEHGEPEDEHYEGISVEALATWAAKRFTFVLSEQNVEAGDTYLYARKGIEMDARPDIADELVPDEYQAEGEA